MIKIRFKVWLAKRLTGKIENMELRKEMYIGYIERISGCIKEDKIRLNKLLKTLSKEDNLLYGYETGFVEKADYLIMKKELEEENV